MADENPGNASDPDRVPPAKALEKLKRGNKHFVSGRSTARDWPAEVERTSEGQDPFAAVVSCLDSRIPPEVIFDQGLGALFVARVAGNFVNDDILGSLEFAAGANHASLIVILGHTGCGAIEGAIDERELGLLTKTLANINPAVQAVPDDYDPRTSENRDFVQAVAEMNVKMTLRKLHDRSVVLRRLLEAGEIRAVGAMYDVRTGKVEFSRRQDPRP